MKQTIETFEDTFFKMQDPSSAEVQDFIAQIILAAAYDTQLVEEAFNHVNSKFNWSSAIEKTMVHAELN